MKTTSILPLIAALATISTAQTDSPVYVTTTIDDCPTETGGAMVTVTDGVTVTYCPACEHDNGMGTTTVYTTTYLAMCSSTTPYSLTPATYTVTESCSDAAAGAAARTAPGYIPQGFTVTTEQCDQCATPGPVTITEPCGCQATNGVPVTSAQQTGADNARAGGPVGGAGHGAPTPYGAGSSSPLPSAYGHGVSWGNTSNITPYSSKGARAYAGGVIAITLGAVIGGLAILL